MRAVSPSLRELVTLGLLLVVAVVTAASPLTRPRTSWRDPRTAVLEKLLRTDDELRADYSTLFDQIANHVLTREFRN